MEFDREFNNFSFIDTSRTPRLGEINGKEYHFVSRERMEEDIEAGKFIEYGEYKGNLYGTSGESVSSLVNAGFVSLLSPHYQALKMLRTPQMKPYIIYIKPPRFEILKETRNEARARSTFDETNSRGFKVYDRNKTFKIFQISEFFIYKKYIICFFFIRTRNSTRFSTVRLE